MTSPTPETEWEKEFEDSKPINGDALKEGEETKLKPFGYKYREGNEVFEVTDWGIIKKFIRKTILSERTKAREEIKEILEKLWKTDPRSKAGKKQQNTDAWMLGYRTAQKELALMIDDALEAETEKV
jgi:hypothetical protein